jgi:hypothetical protein
MVDGQAIEAKSNNCQLWCCKSANPTPIVHPCSCWLGGSMHCNGLSMLISIGSKFLQDTQHKFYPTIQTTCQQVATGAHKLDIDLGLDWFLDLPMKKKKKKKKMLFIPPLANQFQTLQNNAAFHQILFTSIIWNIYFCLWVVLCFSCITSRMQQAAKKRCTAIWVLAVMHTCHFSNNLGHAQHNIQQKFV